jgi:hypothetical protein
MWRQMAALHHSILWFRVDIPLSGAWLFPPFTRADMKTGSGRIGRTPLESSGDRPDV